MVGHMVFPWDGHDQEDVAEAWYNQPQRAKNRQLEEENMRLKRLLREHGIPWSPAVAASSSWASSSGFAGKATKTTGDGQAVRRTRASIAAAEGEHSRLPHLPVEVLLRILQYALTSKEPIIDPLSKAKPDNMTNQERDRDNQIAIHFLATCKAFNVEGARLLWANNTFVFTSVEALRNFSELDLVHRRNVKFTTLRIIARFYDDEKRTHKIGREYHTSLKKDVAIKIIPRQKEEESLSRRGFHCYTWAQTVDFLHCLRAPFDPKHDKKSPRPRLFPNLESMRIDFVNFPEYFLPFSETDLHEIASHDLGCTLNELIVTGLPCCEVGMKAGADLQGMVKDDGLFLDGSPAFIQYKSSLRSLFGHSYCAKVVRAWRRLARERKLASHTGSGSSSTAATVASSSSGHTHSNIPEMPFVPEEEGHPMSIWKKRKTLWKRVPISRDSDERRWVEFDRNSGYPVDDVVDMWDDEDSDEDGHFICPKCGEVHGPFGSDDEDDDLF